MTRVSVAVSVAQIAGKKLIYCVEASIFVVLTRRFELPTSPLPRECSTPELRQPLTCNRCENLAQINQTLALMQPI